MANDTYEDYLKVYRGLSDRLVMARKYGFEDPKTIEIKIKAIQKYYKGVLSPKCLATRL